MLENVDERWINNVYEKENVRHDRDILREFKTEYIRGILLFREESSIDDRIPRLSTLTSIIIVGWDGMAVF